jgi:hypothetical protein
LPLAGGAERAENEEMQRRQFSPEQVAAIREQVPEFDEVRFTRFAETFESGIRRVAEREGGMTAAILRLTLPKAFGITDAARVSVDEAASRIGMDPDAVLAIMQSAIHEAGDRAHEHAH